MNGFGFAKPEDELELINALTPGTSQQQAPMIPAPPTVQKRPLAPSPMPIAPPAVAPTESPAPAPMRLPGMPEDFGGDEIDAYLNTQKKSLNKYGPEAQMDLQDRTLDERNSLRNRLVSGGKGFADAIMMGVAGAGNPGWQQDFDNRQDAHAKERMDTMRNASTANIQRTATGMNIDQMDPNSPLSKSKQQSYAPLFEKLGYEPGSLEKMSGANIDNALQLMATYGGAEMAAMIKQFESQIEQMRLNAMLGKDQQSASLAERKLQADSATEVLKRSGNAKVLGIPIPFTSDVSGKDEDAARQVHVDLMKGGTSQSEAPYGETTERGGIQYQWSPVTKKYHRVDK